MYSSKKNLQEYLSQNSSKHKMLKLPESQLPATPQVSSPSPAPLSSTTADPPEHFLQLLKVASDSNKLGKKINIVLLLILIIILLDRYWI